MSINKLRHPLLILALIIFFAFVVRLYRFNGPIADWHSWRQADTSAVSRNFVKYGFDLLHPRFDDLSNVPSGLDNPQGYRFVEFPVYNSAQAGLFKFLGVFTIEEWGRLVTIFSSLLSVLFIYLIVSKRAGKLTGLLSAFFFAFTPYNIYYGRTILPDPSMAMTVLGGIYFFDRWIEKKSWIMFGLALLFAAVSLLLKPYAAFFLLPLAVIAWEKFGINILKKWQLYIFAFLAVLPLILWRLWIKNFPAGIPASSWLLNGNGIRFRPAFFRWIFYERLTKLISGYGGVVFLVIGAIWAKFIKHRLFFYSFLVASLLYITVFATGNVQHDYYQILIMPTIAIFMGIGSAFLLTRTKSLRVVCSLLFIISLGVMFYFSWKQVRDYFNINNPSIIVAGEAVDRLTPKNAKVIANYTGDTSFLYQTKRQGWASYEKPLPEMIKMGADFLVLANPTKDDFSFAKTYKIIAQTPQYVLYDLHQKP
ncbi:MAG TPA: glycosyltransferase family 39 protein [Candidatus Saccharimonadales bacterium]|nr:glycosyltransferase family 39 protein [Candidatus Saccharimonadales bacterium]